MVFAASVRALVTGVVMNVSTCCGHRVSVVFFNGVVSGIAARVTYWFEGWARPWRSWRSQETLRRTAVRASHRA